MKFARTARELILSARHPYTLALLKGRAHGALTRGTRLETIAGAPSDLAALPVGCAFAERCPLAAAECREAQPPVVDISPGHRVRCVRTAMTAPSYC